MDKSHAQRVRREVAVMDKVRASGWCRVVHFHSLGLGAQSRRSPPIPPLPDLPILVKLGIESEAVKDNRAAQDVSVATSNRMSLARYEHCRGLFMRAFIESH
jgi:hypothetical protein